MSGTRGTRAVVTVFATGLLLLMVLSKGIFDYTDRPQFCYTCHSMMPTYENWQASAHGPVKCSDCHSPDNLKGKLIYKVNNGLGSLYKTATGQVPSMIHLSDGNKQIIMQNCIRCHHEKLLTSHIPVNTYCWSCHKIKNRPIPAVY